MTRFLQSLVDAISLGAVYSLAALGIGLVFGVLRLVNFAHGELIMAGAYSLVVTRHLPLVVGVAACVVVVVTLAVLMELVLYRRVRNASPATMLVTSFALSFLLQRVAELIFGAQVRSVSVVSLGSVTVGGVRIAWLSVVAALIAAALVALLALFLRRTATGLQVQAAAADFRMARLLGVRANRVISVTFALGGVLAAAVAFVLTAQRGQVGPTFGLDITVIALVGAVVGGIDRLVGAAAGGFLIGVAYSELSTYLPLNGRVFRDTWVFTLVIVVLLVRPAGLFASRGSDERM